MRAVLITNFGIENITVGDIEDPSPAPGEGLIAAEAATVNPVDLSIVTGSLARTFPRAPRLPTHRAGMSRAT